ncbi:RNA polymerase sigma factor [Psychroserpens luteolus]|uniref:RNA polymerase sigma factor n=1 Tax=Psychroserpens luteolus TaxID=2855840 RepID=UPI001E65DC4D|nr:RNA polymerase sigma-70 factor [Psychroserpens luteolus]MCD2258263.1 RNA polymerase sigma-70 factor [Psychroserpens luteolus]
MATIKNSSMCDEKTYELFFKTHSKVFRNYIYYKCGDIQQAEDIVQDTFIKLWKNCAKVALKKAKSYMFTLANNAFLNQVTHKKVVLEYQKTIMRQQTNESPEFILEEKEFLLKLNKAIADLPEKQRVVFLLSRIDKKKYREISELLGISIKAVEKRMSQALDTLRKKISNI